MKLLTKTTLYFVTVSLLVFFAGGVGLYKIMQNLVEHEVNADLYSRIHYLYDNIRQLNSLGNVVFIITEPIDIQKVNKPGPSTFRLNDTVLYNQNLKAYMPYRQLSTTGWRWAVADFTSNGLSDRTGLSAEICTVHETRMLAIAYAPLLAKVFYFFIVNRFINFSFI